MAGRDGRSDLYELREILALAAMVALADAVGVPAAKLVGCSEDLFAFSTRICGSFRNAFTSARTARSGRLRPMPKPTLSWRRGT